MRYSIRLSHSTGDYRPNDCTCWYNNMNSNTNSNFTNKETNLTSLITNLSFHLAFFNGTVVGKYLERRTPFLQLHLPVQHHARWNDNQMRTPDALLTRQIRQQRDCLNGFAETHLISKNAVQSVFVHRGKPVKTNMLVLSQRVTQKEWNSCFHLMLTNCGSLRQN